MILSIFTITPDNMATMLDYIGAVFTDLSPIILLIVGVGLGLMAVGVIIKSLRG